MSCAGDGASTEDRAMERRARSLLILCVALLLGGCVVPTPGKKPFPDTALQRIEPGVSDAAAVRAVLGEPDAARLSNRYWVYGGTRTLGTFVIPGGILGSDAMPLGASSWVMVEFDQRGRVGLVEHMSSKGACSNHGPCVLHGFVERSCTPEETTL